MTEPIEAGVPEDGDALDWVLRQAILESGLSLRKVAEEAGVSHQGVARFVSRERGLTLEVAGRLCRALDLSLYPDEEIRRLRAELRRMKKRLKRMRSKAHPTGHIPADPSIPIDLPIAADPIAEAAGPRYLGPLKREDLPWLWDWIERTGGKYYLNHLWPAVDRYNRPLFKLSLKLGGKEAGRLNLFVACIVEHNPRKEAVLSHQGLARAFEIISFRIAEDIQFTLLGARIGPEDIDRIASMEIPPKG